MSAQPEPAPTQDPSVCPLCGTPVSDVVDRCPECGYDLAGVGRRPTAYSRAALMWTVVAFVIVYAVILAVVALAN